MYIIIVPPKHNKLNMFEVVLTRNPDSEEKADHVTLGYYPTNEEAWESITRFSKLVSGEMNVRHLI
jgi:hypothetical protein